MRIEVCEIALIRKICKHKCSSTTCFAQSISKRVTCYSLVIAIVSRILGECDLEFSLEMLKGTLRLRY